MFALKTHGRTRHHNDRRFGRFDGRITKILRRLPGDFKGSVFIVVHASPQGPGFLAQVLDRESEIPVQHPMAGERIKAGRVYVAPLNHHLLCFRGILSLAKVLVKTDSGRPRTACSGVPPNPMVRAL